MGAPKARKQESWEQKPASELRERKSNILSVWKVRVQEKVQAADSQSSPALMDSMPAFIDRLIEAMAGSRSEREKAFQAALSGADHGVQRAELPGYTLDQVLIEYRILREVIFDVLKASGALTESAMDSIDDSIQVGMSSAAAEFLRIRIIRETEARNEVDALNKRLRGLQSVTDCALARTPSLQDLLYELLGRVRQVFECDTVIILMLDKMGESLTTCAAHGLEDEVKQGLRIPLSQGIAGKIYSERHALFFEDLSQVKIYSPLLREKALKSLMGAPLRTAHTELGVIHVGWLQQRNFSLDEATLLQMIADRIAVAIENSKLYEDKQKNIVSLTEAQSLEKRFLSILTFDIRNPMSSAQILAEMLKKKAGDPKIVRSLSQRISTALGRSDKLIQDLLDVNKIINREPLDLEPEKINLHDLIAEDLVSLVMLYGDRFILQEDRAIEGHWSRPHLSRVVELALDIGLRHGKEQSPILIATKLVGDDIQMSFHFGGDVESPRSLSSVPSEKLDGALAQRESRLSLNWTLIESFVKAHHGHAEFISSAEYGTDILTVFPRDPFKDLSLKQA
jgi:K+-sensing histidine kinase KdpD